MLLTKIGYDLQWLRCKLHSTGDAPLGHIFPGELRVGKYLRNIPTNRNSLFLMILGLVGYFSFYIYITTLFSQVGINAKQYSTMLFSFNSARIADFNRQMIEGSKLNGYIYIHQLNLVNPLIFAFVFFLLSSMIVRRLNCPARLEHICVVIPFISIIIAAFDLTATSLVLISTTNPLNVPIWIAVCLGLVNLIRYPLLLGFFAWLAITLGYICIKMINNDVKRGRGKYS